MATSRVMAHCLVLVLLLAVFPATGMLEKERFSESALLRPLSTKHTLASFEFRLTAMESDGVNFGFFPKAVAQAMLRFGVREIHHSLTRGRWNSAQWDEPVVPAAPGAETLIYLDNEDTGLRISGIDRWKGVTRFFDGLFCMSLSEAGLTEVYARTFSSDPFEEKPVVPQRVYHGISPRETMCTENLSAWLKLLPCGEKVGLASLLSEAPTVFSAAYKSFGVHVRTKPSLSGIANIEVIMTMNLVMRQKTEYATSTDSDWSMGSLFGIDKIKACPLATESRVIVQPYYAAGRELTHAPAGIASIKPKPTAALGCSSDGESFCARYIYDLHEEVPIDIRMSWDENTRLPRAMKSMHQTVKIRRFLTRTGQGGHNMVIEIEPNGGQTIQAVLYATIPNFVIVYFHTLQYKVDGILRQASDVLWSKPLLLPSRRKGVSTIELPIILTAGSTLLVSVEIEMKIRHVDDHPPDPERGEDLPSAVLTFPRFDIHDTRGDNMEPFHIGAFEGKWELNRNTKRVYTDAMIVEPPTPDFSMPYNVILLTCSVGAIFFGKMLSATTGNIDSNGELQASLGLRILKGLRRKLG